MTRPEEEDPTMDDSRDDGGRPPASGPTSSPPRQIGVRRIVAFSQSGFTARLVARYRPPSPIMAFTPDARVARQIQLIWGVRPFVAEFQVGSLEDIVNVVERELLAAKLVVPGDRIIILMGHPVRERPLANLLRVHLIRQL